MRREKEPRGSSSASMGSLRCSIPKEGGRSLSGYRPGVLGEIMGFDSKCISRDSQTQLLDAKVFAH